MKIGIDVIKFYTSKYYLDAKDLAAARGIPVEKYLLGLEIDKMSVLPPNEDAVTMGANAAVQTLKHVDKKDINMLLFATESGIDQSKSAGLWVHELLELPKQCRVVELKQACYSGTAAIHMAVAMVRQNPDKKIMVIMSDNARYEINSPGEPTQGCGAIAMIISKDPRTLSIDEHSGVFAESAMDFWRPNYKTEPVVDGKLSINLYLHALKNSLNNYIEVSGKSFKDLDYFCYHVPFPKMVKKAHTILYKAFNKKMINNHELEESTKLQLLYPKLVGNTYTASLYMSFLSLIENTKQDLSNKNCGFYSYGSGYIGEFFSGVIQPNYELYLDGQLNKKMIEDRTILTVIEYEEFYHQVGAQIGNNFATGKFKLDNIENHIRSYKYA